MSSGLANWGDYGQSAGSGMVPGHSLGRGTGVQRYGKRECQMSLSLRAGLGKEVQSNGGEQSVG